MKIMVTGSEGMLGQDISKLIKTTRNILVPVTKSELNIADGNKVKAFIQRIRPNIIINCAAYTNVDLAEQESLKAISVNGFGPYSISEAANEIGAKVVHISTDYVFNGNKISGPYLEEDRPDPISVYGASKLVGEEMIKANTDKYFIVRTAGLYGAGGDNFVRRIVANAKEFGRLEVVYDQFTNPTSTMALSEAIMALIETEHYGIHHLAAAGACSWYEFAQEIVNILEIDVLMYKSKLKDAKRAAERPYYSVLGQSNPESPKMEYWRYDLKRFLADKSNYAPKAEQILVP